MAVELIDNVEALKLFLEALPGCQDKALNLYVDLEGNKLSRHGTLSIITILVKPQQTIHLIDVTKLQDSAFNTAAKSGRNLKAILESRRITKVFFDVRRNSDALFSHYGITLQGVEDLHLMELAARPGNKRFVAGLAKCVEQHISLPESEKLEWKKLKEQVTKEFNTPNGLRHLRSAPSVSGLAEILRTGRRLHA